MIKRKLSKLLAIVIVAVMLLQMLPTVAFADPVNVALGKTVTGDGTDLEYIVDGDDWTRWTGEGMGTDTIIIDLGDTYTITSAFIKSYFYMEMSFSGAEFESSINGTDYTPIQQISNNYQTDLTLNFANPVIGRYFRLRNIQGLPPVDIGEIELYGITSTAASGLSVSVTPGTTTDSTAATISGPATDHFVTTITDESVGTVFDGQDIPTSSNLVNNYASGSDITSGVAEGKYLQVYDVNSNGKVAGFYQKQLAAEDIKADNGGTGQAADYAITKSGSAFQVNGSGSYTFSQALEACIDPGSDAELVIELGTEETPLVITGTTGGNPLKSATYTGSVTLQYGGDTGFLISADTTVCFKNMKILYTAPSIYSRLASILNQGTLHLDSGSEISIQYPGYSTNKPNIINETGAHLYINGATVTSRDNSVIENYGTIEMTDGRIEVEDLNSTMLTALSSYGGAVTISGGTVKANNTAIDVRNSATSILNISGGNIVTTGSSSASRGIYVYANMANAIDLNITGGIIEATNTGADSEAKGIEVRRNNASANITINASGGEISSAGLGAGSYALFAERSALVNISGDAKIIGARNALQFNGTTLNIDGGTIESTHVPGQDETNPGSAVRAGSSTLGTVNMTGGTLKSASDYTVRMEKIFSPMYIPDPNRDKAKFVIGGKEIYGRYDLADVVITGETENGEKVITTRNYANATLMPFNITSEYLFLSWTSDSYRYNHISTDNPATIQSLTTGSNAGVSKIYLNMGTTMPPAPSGPTNGSFTDTDGATGKIGGTITWTPTYSNVIGYKIYWGTNSNPKSSLAYTVNGAGNASQAVPQNTTLPADVTRFVIYSYGLGGESAAGTDAVIVDNKVNEDIAVAVEALDETDFTYAEGEDKDNVSHNFTLPLTGSNGTTISWQEITDTANNVVINPATGVVTVTRPSNAAGDQTVVLTATISKAGGTSETKDLTVVVKATTTGEEANADIATAKGLLPETITATEGSTINLLTYLNGITGMSNTGVTLSLDSSNANVANDGAITYTDSQVTGDVVVHINKENGTADTKTISVTVPAHNSGDEGDTSGSYTDGSGNTYTYTVNGDGTATITAFTRGSSTDIVIPGIVDEFTVTQIGDGAFKSKGLTEVTIPESVTSIGDEAFSWNNLASVTIPDNVTSIGNQAFEYNFNTLVSVTLGSSLVSIGDDAFLNDKLASVTIPDSVRSIGNNAFSGSTNDIATVTLGSGLESIGDFAFSDQELETLTIPESVTSIGTYAFAFNKLTDVTIENRNLSISYSAFYNNTSAGLTIHGYTNSTAQTFATTYEYTFEALDAVNSVSVSPSSASVMQGNSQQLTATVDVVGGAAQTVNWTSSDISGKVAVDGTGNVTVASDAVPGEYTITATSTVDGSKQGTATITVTAAQVVPYILTQPSSQTVETGQSVTFTVEAAGTEPLSYQWKKDGEDITGATSATLTINTAQASDEGSYTVVVSNEAGEVTSNTATLTVNHHSNGGSDSSTDKGTDILVNGKNQNAGTAATTKVDDKTVTTVTLDPQKIEEKLQSEGRKAVVTIPVNTKADVVVGQLNGQTVKNMEAKEAVLEIKTDNATYTLPASQINIDNVSAKMGAQIELKDISVNVTIAAPSADTTKVVEDTANKNNYQVVVKPVEFEITCTSGNKTVEVSKFNGYIERTVAIPAGVDPSKITTGVVLNADGTFSHVPTKVIVIDGKYYAKINSLTNSTYSVIWHPLEFKDMNKHWAKEAVNDMGSRLVVSGYDKAAYKPDSAITRAEFAAIVVKALGLRNPQKTISFRDVTTKQWYYDAVRTAYDYGIISGYSDGTFRPDGKITREEAMAMIGKAMAIANINTSLTDAEAAQQLSGFVDGKTVSSWAKKAAAITIKSGIVGGYHGKLSTKTNVTRAETAVMVRNTLKKANLI